MIKSLKNFFGNQRKMTIFGLFGSIFIFISFIYNLIFTYDFHIYIWDVHEMLIILYEMSIYKIAIFIYFASVFIKMFFKKGNVKIAKYILFVSLLISLINDIFFNLNYVNNFFNFNTLKYLILLVIITLYIYVIFFENTNTELFKFINNRAITIVFIIFVIIGVVRMSEYYFLKNVLNIDTLFEWFIECLKYVGLLFIIPYFYNYYNILKGVGSNE